MCMGFLIFLLAISKPEFCIVKTQVLIHNMFLQSLKQKKKKNHLMGILPFALCTAASVEHVEQSLFAHWAFSYSIRVE